jgi:hypothetical protein
MNDARLYAKIMSHMERRTGTTSWDFRTLRQSSPHLSAELERIVVDCEGVPASCKADLGKHYVPYRVWDYR